MSYHEIRNSHDIASFIAETNGLHDGYLVFAHYDHTGFGWGNPLVINDQKAILKLQIMVTSMHNKLIELVFEAVRTWKIKDNQNEILDTSVSFTDDGWILWCSDDSAAISDGDYVIAKSMKWRIIPDHD